MAGTEQDESVSESDIFDAAFSAEPTPVKETSVSDASGDGSPPRDEHGRFAAKSQDEPSETPQEPKAEAEPQQQEAPAVAAPAEPAKADPKEDRDGWIPSWRAREISEAKKAAAERAERAEAEAKAHAAKWEQAQRESAELKRRLDELTKPKQEPVNLFENPEGFVGSVEERLARERDSFQGELRKIRLENNLAISAIVYKEDFPPAYEAFVKAVEGGDRATATRVFNSADPGGSIVAWHRERKTLDEIGNDPASYVQKKLDEALNDPEFLAKALERAKAQATGQPAAQPGAPAARPNLKTQLPPSLRTMPGAAAASDGTGIQHMSEDELFNAALGR